MRLTIDRIENNIVVCETEERTTIELALTLFPPEVKEGDFIIYENNKISIDAQATQQRKKQMNARFAALAKKKK